MSFFFFFFNLEGKKIEIFKPNVIDNSAPIKGVEKVVASNNLEIAN